jgi:hypothetical protein
VGGEMSDTEIQRGRICYEKGQGQQDADEERALRFFARLREISSETGLPCRDIETAYFMKD